MAGTWHALEVGSLVTYGAVFGGYHVVTYFLSRRRRLVSVMDLAFPLWLHSVALDSGKLTAAIQSVRRLAVSIAAADLAGQGLFLTSSP